MSSGRVVRERKGVELYSSLPALVVTTDKSFDTTPKQGKNNEKVSFTNLYRNAVLNKGWNEQTSVSQKELEFMGLIPSNSSRLKSKNLLRDVKKSGNFVLKSRTLQKKVVSFSLPNLQVRV